jgi:hypothetical protein
MVKEKEESTERRLIVHQYKNRLLYLRQGQEYSAHEDIPRAVDCYNRYLNVVSDYFSSDPYKLKPTLYDKDKGLSELLLISQVYWDLAKAYDRNPKFHKKSEICLGQFVLFTVGFKYQYINAEMLRKFIKRKMAYNLPAFKASYEQIRINTKKCYIATYCYNESHPTVTILRKFRTNIIYSYWGALFVDCYQVISPKLVTLFEKTPTFGRILRNLVLRPLIAFLAKNIEKSIIK